MAYNPTYYPSAYSMAPDNFRMPQMPYQPMPVNPQPDPAPVNWVQGEAGAKAFIVKPGSSVIMMDSEGDFFYMKMVDMSGMPSLRKFKYEEIGNQQISSSSGITNHNDYVSRMEFDELKKQIQALMPQEVSDEHII